MKNIIAAWVNRPVAVVMALGALALSGVLAGRTLPLNKMPDIPIPRVTVETRYPGMGAEEVRQMVTIPLEDAFSPVKGLEGLESVSRDETSLITLTFRWGINPEDAAARTREAVDGVYPSLNEGIEKPLVFSGGYAGEAQAVIAVRALNGDGSFERNLADYELRARLRKLDGTGGVVLSGGEAREIQVAVDSARLVSRGMSVSSLASLLSSEIADLPAGSVREGDRELTAVTRGRPSSLGELGEITLPGKDGGFRLRDLGEVKVEKARRKSLFIFGDRDQTALEVYRRPGADPVKFSRDIKKAVEEAAGVFGKDAEITLVWDASAGIVAGLKNLGLSLLLSTAAVAVVLMIFLGSPRCSLLAGLAIPFSGAAALSLLAFSGRSLNDMSLGGITLGIGLVSDTAVIVLETLCRRFSGPGGLEGTPLSGAAVSSGPAGAAASGGPMEVPAPTGAAVRSWVAEAAASVSLSSLAGTATTVVVFVPVLFLPGALGSLYGDLAAALAASVIAGWVYAQFCLPCLFGIFLHRVLAPGRRKTPPSFRKPAGIYGRILKACMGWPLPLALLAGALCVLGTLLTLFRPAAFLDPGSAAELELRLDFETLTTLEAALPRGLGASAILSRIPGIETFYGRMGAEAEDRDRRSRPDYRKECLLFRCFLRKGTDASKAIGEIREALREGGFVQGQGGLSLSISVPEDFTQSLLGLSQGRRLAVRGGSREEVLARTEEAVRVLQERLAESGERPLGEIRVTPTGKRPEIRLIPRREAAAYAGVSVLTLAETVYGSTEGIVTGRIEMNGHPLEIRVKDKGGTDFELLPLASDMASAGGAGTTPPLFLGSLSRREKRETEAVLLREDRSDVIYLDLIPRTGKEKVLFRHISDLLGSEKKALGEKGISGAGESIFVRYKDSLMVTIVTVLVLLYITLGAQFESFRLPFLFLLAIPFSLAGAGPALALTGSGLDSGSVLALIVLFGLAVNNGIVLYESAEEQHGAGLPAREAVFRGSVERLRPVCITTATTVLALLPLCFSPLGGSQVSLARTMTGGIIASTLLSLLVLPPGFVPFLKARERRRIP